MIPLGVWWYVSTLIAGLIWLIGSPLSDQLSLSELVATSIPVGTIASAWILYIAACAWGAISPFALISGNVCILLFVAERLPSFRAKLPRLLASFWSISGERLDAAIAWGVTAVLVYPFWSLYSSRMLPVGASPELSPSTCCCAKCPDSLCVQ